LDNITTSTIENNKAPKFFGPIWKPEHTESSTKMETKINAWNYLRIMQYYNVPRGVNPSSTKIDSLHIMDSRDSLGKKNPQNERKFRTVKFSNRYNMTNDLLEYFDHSIHLYLSDIHGQNRNGNGGIIGKMKFTAGANGLTEMEAKDLDVKFRALCGRVASTIGIPNSNFKFDYPRLRDDEINDPITNIQGITNMLRMDDLIHSEINGASKIRIYRFMDAMIRFRPYMSLSNSNTSDGSLYRIVGEIVAIDQFALSQVILGAVTIDHGLHNWFTPIIDWDNDYIEKIVGLTSGLTDNVSKIGKLVYVRFRSGEIIDGKREDYSSLTRIAVFNRDSFGEFLTFFSNSSGTSLHTLGLWSTVDFNPLSVDIDTNAWNATFLSAAISTIEFPQTRNKTPYEFFIKMKNVGMGQQLIDTLTSSLRISATDDIGKLIINIKATFLYNSTSYGSLVSNALRADDHLINFLSDIPSTFMRADVYTGSKFKTFAVDAFSIVRLIQILSSTMGGFPSTNNPAQTRTLRTSISGVDNYPVFLSNRIVVIPEMLFAEKKAGTSENTVFAGYRSFSNFFDVNSPTISSTVSHHTGYFFLRLRIGIRLQESSPNRVNFKIPINDITSMSIVKGASTNHLFTFTIPWDDIKYMSNIISTSNNIPISEIGQITLKYNLEGERGESGLGVSPPEMAILSLQDMMQDDNYHPLFSRIQPNTFIRPEAGTGEERPVNNPELAWASKKSSVLDYGKGLCITRKNQFGNIMVTKETLCNPSNIHVGKESARLIGIRSYVDISDLQKEIQTLTKLSTDEFIAYTELSNSRSRKKLLDILMIHIPFKIEIMNNGRLSVTQDETSEFISVTEFLRTIEPFTKITVDQMMWNYPLEGYVLRNINVGTGTTRNPENLHIYPVTLIEHSRPFQPYVNNYLVISLIDLIVKGLRYILWTLNKSRFLCYVTLPLIPSKHLNPDAEIPIANPNNIIGPGSSIIFTSDDKENTQVYRNVQPVKSNLKEFLFPVNSIQLLQTVKNHKLSSLQYDSSDYFLVWYVSKLTTFISADQGMNISAYCTEGSFDWTIFYREDTMLTRISEYYLKRGMGNFFLSRGGR
jgi:hypothetical protein